MQTLRKKIGIIGTYIRFRKAEITTYKTMKMGK